MKPLAEIFHQVRMLVHRYPFAAGTAVIFIFLLTVPACMQKMVIGIMKVHSTRDLAEPGDIETIKKQLEREAQQAERRLAAFTPRSYYLVVNSSSNRFILYRGGREVWSGRCSTGSYILLKNGEEQQWMFKTPKGEFRIQGKTANPVWKKPDWAFVEEGLPVPPVNHTSRFEFGVLGDYALSLGDGYLIHGTLFQRYLGLPVTHGCIRLGDKDLEVVYNALNYGSKVYIY